jgi:hypothetical protein
VLEVLDDELVVEQMLNEEEDDDDAEYDGCGLGIEEEDEGDDSTSQEPRKTLAKSLGAQIN